MRCLAQDKPHNSLAAFDIGYTMAERAMLLCKIPKLTLGILIWSPR
jgi:hypothetical protein